MTTNSPIVPMVWGELWAAMENDWNNPDGPAEWFATTEEMYDEMLGALPPKRMRGGAFLVGEPWTHNDAGEAVYACFRRHAGQYQAQYMTAREFDSLFRQR